MTTLLIAAHPDDEVLGCGGTAARLAREGNDVHIAILGEGITARRSEPGQAKMASVVLLHEQSRRVADLLGAKEPFLYGLPDNRLDTLPLLDIVKIIEDLIERLQPQVVYTHHGGDLNIDHRIVHRATLTATRPLSGCPVKEVCAYEVPSSTDWAFQQFRPAFQANVFEDISDTLDIKVKAMALYESESHPFPHPRSADAIKASAWRWGGAVGLEAAEAFALLRCIR
jgi:LmbE family N-acetylglucosaminyl deacetylase